MELDGSLLGPYLLGSRIGQGGAGEVYEATDMRKTTEAAVKVLRSGSDHTTTERFSKEIEFGVLLGRRFRNPYIAQILEHGSSQKLRWFAMERLHGKTLRALIQDSPPTGMPWEAAVWILRDICIAVNSLHERGIVHRDLKPENVFLSYTGDANFSIKLLDFGIAKEYGKEPQTSSGHNLTTRHDIPGTVPYMAPERINPEKCFPAIDQYSLGVVLFECLHRRLPFPQNEDEASLPVYGSLDKLPWKPSIPRNLREIALRAMARDYRGRFPSASNMAQALERFIESTPTKVDGLSAVIELLKLQSRIAETSSFEDKTTHPIPPLVRSDEHEWRRFRPVEGDEALPKEPEKTAPLSLSSSQPAVSAEKLGPQSSPNNPVASVPVAPVEPAPAPITQGSSASLVQDISASTGCESTPVPPDSQSEPRSPSSSRSPESPKRKNRSTHETDLTQEEPPPPPSRLLARYGFLMVGMMKFFLTIAMLSLAAMAEVAADPGWLRLQEKLEQKEKSVIDETPSESDELILPRASFPRTPPRPSPAGRAKTLLAPTSASSNTPSAAEAAAVPPVGTSDLDPTPAPGVVSRSLTNEEPSAEKFPASSLTAAGASPGRARSLEAEKVPALLPLSTATSSPPGSEDASPTTAPSASIEQPLSEQDARRQQAKEDRKILNQALGTAQRHVKSICKLSVMSPVGKASVCVRFVVSTKDKTVTSVTEISRAPSGITFTDPRKDCVAQVASNHIVLASMARPSTFEKCFEVIR